MRGDSYDGYVDREKYNETHSFFGNQCMMVQKRTFDISNATVKEIPLSLLIHPNSTLRYDPFKVVNVHELDFGPSWNSKKGRLSIWFNVDETNHLVPFCPENKSSGRKGKCVNETLSIEYLHGLSLRPGQLAEEPVPLICPNDREAYNLVTDVMMHRVAVLQNREMVTHGILPITFLHKQDGLLEEKLQVLKSRFDSLMHHFKSLQWPGARNVNAIKSDVHVPHVKTEYNISPSENNYLSKIWGSFLDTAGNSFCNGDGSYDASATATTNVRSTYDKSLNIFKQLRSETHLKGREVPSQRLPLLRSMNTGDQSNNSMNSSGSMSRDLCWRGILEKDDDTWEEVRNVFQSKQ